MRGLLIDAHYGLQAGDAVRTDLSERSERSGRRHEAAKRALDRAYTAWEEASENGG